MSHYPLWEFGGEVPWEPMIFCGALWLWLVVDGLTTWWKERSTRNDL